MSLYLGAGGLVLGFVAPAVIDSFAPVQEEPARAALGAVLESGRTAAIPLLIACAAHALVTCVQWARMRGQREPVRSPAVELTSAQGRHSDKAGRPTVFHAFSPSWWKFGRQCYCEDTGVEEVIRQIQGLERAAGGDASGRSAVKAPRTAKKRAPTCWGCNEFQVRQNLKARLLSGFLWLAVAAACVGLWRPYAAVYTSGKARVQQAYERWSFSSHTRPEAPAVSEPESPSPGARMIAERNERIGDTSERIGQVLILVLLGCAALLYATRAMEFFLYRLRW